MKKFYSFDVFDTLVTRKVGLPHHIFIQTAIRACNWQGFDLDARVYATERVNAERELLEKGEIPDLNEIFRRLDVNLHLGQDLSCRLLELELDIESENLVPIKKIVDTLNSYRDAGHHIIYISDMYLNEKHIRRILTDLNIIRDGEKIYVSCEHGVNKTSGALFEKVMADLDIKSADMHHIGNSKSSDINGAKKADINYTWFEEGDLNRYEKLLCTRPSKSPITAEDILYHSKMAASSRLARLENKGHKKHIYDVSASVAGPLLFNFVTFLLEKSEGKTLYFLSRDGYILYKLAERIASERSLDIELKYLFISREVLLLNKLSEKPDREIVDSILKIYSHKTVRDLFRSLSVPQQTMQASSIEESILDRNMSELDNATLTAVLHEDKLFEHISAEVKKRNELLQSYLESEGLFEEKKNILVDVGWNLTIHDLIAEIFNKKKLSPPDGIYFGINYASSYITKGKKTGYLWDLRKNGYTIDIPRKTRIIEVFCSAPQGQTVGYKNDDGNIVPIFNDFEKEYLLNWGIRGIEEAILAFTDEMLKQDVKVISRTFNKEMCNELMEMFWRTPTKDEIDIWGSYPFFATDEEEQVIRLFEKKPFHKVMYHILRNKSLPSKQHESWPDAHYYSLNYFQRKIAKLALKLNLRYLNMKNIIWLLSTLMFVLTMVSIL